MVESVNLDHYLLFLCKYCNIAEIVVQNHTIYKMGFYQMTNNLEANTNPNLATANDLAKMLNANYRTVLKILTSMVESGNVETQQIKKNNRSVLAYLYSNDTIKALQAELKAIRKGKRVIVQNVAHNINTNTINADNTNITTSANTNNEIVTIYEVTKRNNELENQIKTLKLEKKDLEVDKTKMESELYKLQGEFKLIELKQSDFESENAKLNQTLTALNKTLNIQSRVIIGLSTVLVIGLTVIATLAFVGVLK